MSWNFVFSISSRKIWADVVVRLRSAWNGREYPAFLMRSLDNVVVYVYKIGPKAWFPSPPEQAHGRDPGQMPENWANRLSSDCHTRLTNYSLIQIKDKARGGRS